MKIVDAKRSSIITESRHSSRIAVMLCDIVDSTRLSTTATPEQLRHLFLNYYSMCEHIVRQTGGRTARFVGDAVQNIFTVKQFHYDPALMAVVAASRIRQAVRNSDIKDAEGNSLKVRVGIATGQGLVGQYRRFDGSGQEMVWGTMPFLAARLQGLGTADDIVVCETTATVVGKRQFLSDMGKRPLKGFDKPVRAWKAKGKIYSKEANLLRSAII